MSEKKFLFELGQNVAIVCSNENCEVIARAEYKTAENAYLVRYRAADGRATEQWWAESALTT